MFSFFISPIYFCYLFFVGVFYFCFFFRSTSVLLKCYINEVGFDFVKSCYKQQPTLQCSSFILLVFNSIVILKSDFFQIKTHTLVNQNLQDNPECESVLLVTVFPAFCFPQRANLVLPFDLRHLWYDSSISPSCY